MLPGFGFCAIVTIGAGAWWKSFACPFSDRFYVCARAQLFVRQPGLGDDYYFPVDVLANEDVVVLIIYKDQFLKLLHYCPQAQINYLNLISKKTQFLTRKLKFLSFKTLKGKLAHYLLQQNQKNSGSIQIPISQQAMAELFGAARPSIARVFSQLEDEDILRIKNRQVTIMDQEKLIAYLD